MTFLRFLEQRFGRAVFDPFLRKWFDRHAFGSVTTDDFLAFLKTELIDHHPGKVSGDEIAQFVEGPGYPAIAPRTHAARFDAVDQSLAAWLDGKLDLTSVDSQAWSTQEWIRLIEGLPTTVDLNQMASLDAQFKLSSAGNSEIAFAWYLQAIAHHYPPAFPPMADFLERVGRRKFVVPLYTALMNQPAYQAYARETYARARVGYHPITRVSVDAVVK